MKHPAITAGVVVGTLGLATCELAADDHAACFGLAGGAGVVMALITATAIWLGYEDEEEAPAAVDPRNLAPGPVYVPTPDQALPSTRPTSPVAPREPSPPPVVPAEPSAPAAPVAPPITPPEPAPAAPAPPPPPRS